MPHKSSARSPTLKGVGKIVNADLTRAVYTPKGSVPLQAVAVTCRAVLGAARVTVWVVALLLMRVLISAATVKRYVPAIQSLRSLRGAQYLDVVVLRFVNPASVDLLPRLDHVQMEESPRCLVSQICVANVRGVSVRVLKSCVRPMSLSARRSVMGSPSRCLVDALHQIAHAMSLYVLIQFGSVELNARIYL